MTTEKASTFVRLRLELVLEIDDENALTTAALRRLAEEAADPEVPEGERAQAERAVTEDTAEALACLVDPFDLVGDIPGVELQQASWSTEPVEYDPDAPDWDLDEDDDGQDDAAGVEGDGRTGGIG
ncbi:hypothetical protein ACF09K_02650 [Streptomyces sp. NPDC014882]|uniref:hypothetical protein n=1 Tax=Streptomyces sp. NPDC014882 TaxID=3364927 RepID=UPI0036F8D62A